MCHQRTDRSFFIGSRQFPLCARCTGILFGYILGIIIAILTDCKSYKLFPLLLIPMIFDGTLQHFTRYESNNIKRLITGLCGGIGIIYIFICIHMFTVWWVGILLNIIL
ncbi:MAG: DUF2085 domain-containing protein [Clostridia bacterium]|nr:DUF2085 domain-containing protein [Clostridia bacterium]